MSIANTVQRLAAFFRMARKDQFEVPSPRFNAVLSR
jgi:hypothetical protein